MDANGPGVPTIGLAIYRHPGPKLTRRLFDDLLERLRSWARVKVLRPDVDHPDIGAMDLDLFHMAHWHRAAVADVRRAAQAGIPTVNSPEGVSITTDRLAKLQRLVDGGIQVPEFQFGTSDQITIDPPVLVKPRDEFAAGGHAFELIIRDLQQFAGTRVVQKYIAPRRSYKIFGMGDAVRTIGYYPETSNYSEVETTKRFRTLAERVGELFDLSVFELDVVVHKTFYAIDVNPVVSLQEVADGPVVYENCLRDALRGARSRPQTGYHGQHSRRGAHSEP